MFSNAQKAQGKTIEISKAAVQIFCASQKWKKTFLRDRVEEKNIYAVSKVLESVFSWDGYLWKLAAKEKSIIRRYIWVKV